MNSTTKTNFIFNNIKSINKNDLCRIVWQNESALVVVHRTCDSHFIGLLVHAYPELATETDMIIYGLKSYPVVVQTMRVGCFWYSQVDEVICTLPDDWKTNSNTGVKLSNSLDARYAFKLEELERLQYLTADCTATRLGEE